MKNFKISYQLLVCGHEMKETTTVRAKNLESARKKFTKSRKSSSFMLVGEPSFEEIPMDYSDLELQVKDLLKRFKKA